MTEAMTEGTAPASTALPFGAVLAGGESRRYGSPKALATVGGTRIIDRVVSTLGRITPALVLLANEPDLFDDLGLPARPDVRPGLGALGGILTGLLWAREAGRPGILAVACDMPFPCARLLARLRDLAFPDGAGARHDVVIPESRGRRGVEPLCAAYGVDCIPAIEAQLARGDQRMIGFHEAVRVHRVPLREVASLCDPERAFLNVNTLAERERAEILAGGAHDR
jgi:molybdopterin-guanine dinucleotide biosynthesis protein A